jgi:hypothetical protein
MARNHHDLSLLRQRKAALEDALYSGVSSVSVGGETTTFQDTSAIRRAIQELDNLLAAMAPGTNARRKPAVSTIYLGGT